MNDCFNSDKCFRLLNIFERLNRGESLSKDNLASDFNVSLKTIQRDIDDIRAYFSETRFSESEISIKYDKVKNSYYLVRLEREWMTNEEALSICKILLESRAFTKNEIINLTDKLIMQISPADRNVIREIIGSELVNYVPLQHGKPLMNTIWEISKHITSQNIISFRYTRQDGTSSIKSVKPVSVMFSEFYFYLVAFSEDKEITHPIIYRIDRMENLKFTGEKFSIPYRDRFSDGEFRKRIQFMYSGDLKKVLFEYSGVLEAILDRLPTAKVINEKDGVYTITAESYGDGIYMWLRSQGDLVRIL